MHERQAVHGTTCTAKMKKERKGETNVKEKNEGMKKTNERKQGENYYGQK